MGKPVVMTSGICGASAAGDTGVAAGSMRVAGLFSRGLRSGNCFGGTPFSQVARETMDVTDATKEEIDDMFGWKQAERAKDMQLHYEGRRLRSRRARITMMV
jgi:hypothetical protein